MRIYCSLWILSISLFCFVIAEPEPDPAPARALKRRVAYLDDDQLAVELRAAGDLDEKADEESTNQNKPDASSGRLFLKKFLLFRNMFGNSNQQPVIPIIITGAGTGTNTATTGTTAPTTQITSTGSIPTAEGTITTSPTTDRRIIKNKEEENPDAVNIDQADTPVASVDVQALQAALIANAQEYVVTDQEIRGTSDSKSSKSGQSVNLRRKGSNNGQVISVRIPPKYRRYFKAGQRVMLNTNNRPNKRRVVKKRVNRNRRRNGNKNKRNRLN